MLAIALVVLMLLGISAMQSRRLENRLTLYNNKAETLEERIEEEIARTEEIDNLKKYMNTDQYAEEIARNRLGLVKENEIVFQEQKTIQ
ncbi:MAG: septum formation initiator family protein [Blautia sp.]|nr:septum formation initiator family protein [Blautia sp.]